MERVMKKIFLLFLVLLQVSNNSYADAINFVSVKADTKPSEIEIQGINKIDVSGFRNMSVSILGKKQYRISKECMVGAVFIPDYKNYLQAYAMDNETSFLKTISVKVTVEGDYYYTSQNFDLAYDRYAVSAFNNCGTDMSFSVFLHPKQ
jgi:hypothetical protein